MKRLCCNSLLRLPLLLFLFASILYAAGAKEKSALFYYGEAISWPLAGVHDYIVVQPSHIDTYTHGFARYRDKVYAYVSVGEIDEGDPHYATVAKRWGKRRNKTWHSTIVDVSDPAYGDYLLDHIVAPLVERGFANFFFDTLDAYRAIAKNERERDNMRRGLVRFLKRFHTRYPKAHLILNRGFELLEDVHTFVDAVVVESLYKGLRPKTLTYCDICRSDRMWLMAKLDKVKRYGIVPIAVEYLPLDRTDNRTIRRTIEKIRRDGIVPYIGDRHLTRYGYSNRHAVKREILLLYDDTEFDGTDNDDKVYSTAFRQLSVPLEYMGYIPVLEPISTWRFRPTDKDRFAGAVVWLTGTYPAKHPEQVSRHIASILDAGITLLVIDTLFPDAYGALFARMGIRTQTSHPLVAPKMTWNDRYMGYETPPYIAADTPLYHPKEALPLCRIDAKNAHSVPAAITPWGGYLFEGTSMVTLDNQDLWIADPFAVLKKALRLREIPVPDVTTENGRRILFSHIDGDGIMNRAEWDPKRFSGEVIYSDILRKYPLPISVSIVEAETAPYGLYPKLSPQLEAIARNIYALPNVEAATHTFSHPFVWGKITPEGDLDPRYRLDVKGYRFSITRELSGSLRYINTTLIPAGKPKTRMVFWSGDCLPQEPVLRYVYTHRMLQINGGDTMITYAEPWLSLVAPIGIARGNYRQIFTGAQNENVYTDDWHGPYWGFKRVVQTFELTDTPRRLKPIDIYYHYYSGSKLASLNALRYVYDWAMRQETTPLFTSQYIPKAMDFYTVSIAEEDNDWYIAGAYDLHTVRLPASQHVNCLESDGVLGTKRRADVRYVHLAPQRGSHRLRIADSRDRGCMLVDTDALVSEYSREDETTRYRLQSYLPLQLRIRSDDVCRVDVVPQADSIAEQNGTTLLRYRTRKDANVTVSCAP